MGNESNEVMFPRGLLRPELFIGVLSAVSASSVHFTLKNAGAPSGAHFLGGRYGKGEVGEFVLVEGQINLLLGRIVETHLPEGERKSVDGSRTNNIGLDAIGTIQLLGSVAMPVRDGQISTIQASMFCERITSKVDTPLKKEGLAFDIVFKHRNAVLHLVPRDDVTQIAGEQCRAWYLLHKLLTGCWKEIFASFQDRLQSVDESLHLYQPFLDIKYKELENNLKRPKSEGRLFICPACKFESAVMEKVPGGASDYSCAVCKHSGVVIAFNGNQFDSPALLNHLDPTQNMSPKEVLCHDQIFISCGLCHEYQKVAPHPSGYICCACGRGF